MTLANRITIGRLVLIPVFIAFVVSYTRDEPWFLHAALATFIIAALSDALDGFVARAFDQKSKLGAVLDPLADKLLVNLAFVFLAVNEQLIYQLPPWYPVIILGRDIIIVVLFYLLNEFYGPIRVKPRLSGKLTTVFQMSSIVAVLIEFPYTVPILGATLIISVFSFFDYLYTGVRQVGAEDHD